MANITAEQIKTFFDNREKDLNNGKINKSALVIAKYEDRNFKSGANGIVYVPVGFEVVVKKSDGHFVRINADDPYNPRGISGMWIVKPNILGVPWGIGNISYTDNKTRNCAVKFGANGDFGFTFSCSEKWVENFLAGREHVNALNIRDKLRAEMDFVIEPVLQEFALEQSFAKIDKKNCSEKIKNELSELFGKYLLKLDAFTIMDTIENFDS